MQLPHLYTCCNKCWLFFCKGCTNSQNSNLFPPPEMSIVIQYLECVAVLWGVALKWTCNLCLNAFLSSVADEGKGVRVMPKRAMFIIVATKKAYHMILHNKSMRARYSLYTKDIRVDKENRSLQTNKIDFLWAYYNAWHLFFKMTIAYRVSDTYFGLVRSRPKVAENAVAAVMVRVDEACRQSKRSPSAWGYMTCV